MLVFVVMSALGEMCAWLPQASSFSGYAARFVDPAMGFSVGWTYLFKYLITTPNQLTAAALVLQEWVPRSRVNPAVWITIFLILIICINYFGIRFFGEFEFWLSSFKVLVIIGLIILSIILAAGGGPNHQATGFYYWRNPGAFKPYPGIANQDTARFVAFWSTMVTATFAYLGTELIGITVGEAQNPRRTIPRAIRLTFYRILIFYCVSVLLLGMLVPYDSKDLAFAASASTSASASPFVVAIRLAGIPVLPGILNACILLFVISASNSDLYIASRTLYGLAQEGKAPKIFAWTDKRGVPIPALGSCALFACIAYMNASDDSKTVFTYFVNLVTIFGLLTWISILITHIRFVRARRAQGIQDSELAYVAPLGIAGSAAALSLAILIAIFKNFTVFIGKFNVSTFITGYLGIPLYIIMYVGYKLVKRTKAIPLAEVDFYSGKARIDAEEREFLARKEQRMQGLRQKGGWSLFYERCVGFLF
jgi:yeast amino acid transporter